MFYRFFLFIFAGVLLTFLVMKFQKPILKIFYPIEFCDIVLEASDIAFVIASFQETSEVAVTYKCFSTCIKIHPL